MKAVCLRESADAGIRTCVYCFLTRDRLNVTLGQGAGPGQSRLGLLFVYTPSSGLSWVTTSLITHCEGTASVTR